MRRPGGQAPSIQPISITMLGSLTVIQRLQCGAERGDDAGHVAGEDVGRARAEPELLPQPPRVGEVVQRHHRLQAARRAQGEDLGVALQGGVVECTGSGLQAGPLHREAEGVAPDGGGPVERLGGMPPEVARQPRALDPAGGLPAGPVVVRLAVAVEPALDLVARRGHAGQEPLAEQALRLGAPGPAGGRRGRRLAWRWGGGHPVQLGRRSGRPGSPGAGLSGAARASACATARSTRCRPRRAPGAPARAPAARWRRPRPGGQLPARPGRRR